MFKFPSFGSDIPVRMPYNVVGSEIYDPCLKCPSLGSEIYDPCLKCPSLGSEIYDPSLTCPSVLN